jgi:hypothetical protein
MPTVIHTKASKGMARFHKDPVSAVSRPASSEESWAAYDFETHAQKCAYCRDPYEVHRERAQLCEIGHRLAQQVASFLYNEANGETYSTREEDNKPVRVELPSSYTQVRGLLKAIERSLRHRSRTPFVSMDRTYYVAARVPQRTRSVKIEQPVKTKSSRPRSGEIVDWPSSPKPKPKIVTEVNNSTSKRGSLYAQDLETQRRNAKQYTVEVREPAYRRSGYYV